MVHRWKPFDPARNWPDLGARFIAGERTARASVRAAATSSVAGEETAETEEGEDKVEDDQRDLDWSTVLKRTFESYVRGERYVFCQPMLRDVTLTICKA